MAGISRFNRAVSIGVAFAALAATTGTVSAGGFHPKEQSAYFLGTAYAGSAAGGSLSSMFWNSAAVGQFDGINSNSNYTLILPESEITATADSTLAFLGTKSGDIGDTAVLPASYFSYQLSDKIVLGMAVNAPFGLTTDRSNFSWAGQTHARESKIETYNFNPTVAYRVAPGVIVGVGLQAEYIKAGLRSASGAGVNSADAAIKGDDIGFGVTAGILVTPAAGTTLGVGYRSRVEHELNGYFGVPSSVVAPFSIGAAVKADVTLPDLLTVSFRHDIAPAWTLLGTFEWMNWTTVPKLDVVCKDGGNAVLCPGGAGQVVRSLHLGWSDGYFFSLGLEHAYNDKLTLRGGVAYEISPIRNPDERTLRVPDADRVWLGIGASYKYSEWTTIDVSYAHLFVEDSQVDRTEGGVRVVGNVEAHADAISVGVRSKLDWLLSGSGH